MCVLLYMHKHHGYISGILRNKRGIGMLAGTTRFAEIETITWGWGFKGAWKSPMQPNEDCACFSTYKMSAWDWNLNVCLGLETSGGEM